MSKEGKYVVGFETKIPNTTKPYEPGTSQGLREIRKADAERKAKANANAKSKTQAQPQSSTQTEVLSKARNTVTAAQDTTRQRRTASPPTPISTSLVSSTATAERTKDPESSIAIATKDPGSSVATTTEETKGEDEESGEESGEGESGEEKKPIKKGEKVNEIKKEVTSIDVNTPIKRKEINIYNKSFLVETKVDNPLTEEQGLLYEQLYLPEFEGEEDEAWRKQVLQEVINSCTGDFGITTDPKCDIMRSYLEKLALKVFETDQPILWWKDKEVEEKKEDVVYPNEPEENEENEEDEDKAIDYEIMISISLSDLHNLLTQMKVIHSTSDIASLEHVALTNATSPYYLDPTVELSSYINPKRIMPTTDAELQELINEAIKKLTTNKYNNSHKERIAKDLEILKILKTKTLAWLKEHANEKSELNTYGAVNVTWDYLMRAILGMYSINKTHD